ncbi:MAG: AGE family epimerase/isomerase [Promethearchaeota archaeon]
MDNILEYWMKYSLDNEYGGFYGRIDHHNQVIPKSSKSCILNTRILWTFSAAYNFLKKKELLEVAIRAYNYILNHFFDHEYGGLYWEVDYLGNPLDMRKQIYAQAFGIYGFSEYYKACGDIDSLRHAQELFWLIEKYSLDPKNNGYIEALDKKWQPLLDMRLSKKDINEPKSMNTHLHILEAYTNLYYVWKEKSLNKQIENLLWIFLNKIIDQKSHHFQLFFDLSWTVKSSIISFGHDIEGSWLLTEATEALGNEKLLKEINDVVIKLVDRTVKEGTDKSSSLFYENDNKTGEMDFDKHWWCQAEAMIGLVNAWQITGNQQYLKNATDIWDYITQFIINTEHGEWNAVIDKFDHIITTGDRVGFWKGPYHNTRACIEVINRVG